MSTVLMGIKTVLVSPGFVRSTFRELTKTTQIYLRLPHQMLNPKFMRTWKSFLLNQWGILVSLHPHPSLRLSLHPNPNLRLLAVLAPMACLEQPHLQ